MTKITFLGAGSTIFAKNLLGDSLLSPALSDAHIALYDIDAVRLKESLAMLKTLNANINQGRATITAHLGVANRRTALRGARYVINAIQVGGYRPSTVIDFKIPKRYGLRQTIGDTLGIGGIFRTLRTLPVMLDFARDMEVVCPDAWFLNYTNPMAMLTAGLLQGSNVKTVGLCHSVQVCANHLLKHLGLLNEVRSLQWKIAGINHQAWLLEITDGGHDLYPEIKRRAAEMLARARRASGTKHWDMVRHYLMLNFGYYLTESSEHSAEYLPYFIKRTHPELIREFNIPLDEYPRRCENQIRSWKKQSAELVRNPHLNHQRTHEYGSYIMEAMETDVPFRFGGNVMNTGLITNLPAKSCVEVPCIADRNGVQPLFVGDLPEQCAAVNRTNINPQILTVEASLSGRRDYIYQAAMLDPLTSAELTIDEIRNLCDDLIAAHGKMLPRFTDAPAPRRVWTNKTNPAWISHWKISRLMARDEVGRTVRMKDQLGWKPLRATDGLANVHAVYGDKDGIACLAHRFHADKAGLWQVNLGHDGGVRVFVDGRQVFAEPRLENPARPGRSRFTVRLGRGSHELVIALDTHGGAGWGVFCSVSPSHDFGDDGVRRGKK